MNYANISKHNATETPQTEKIVGTNQEKNNAGGYSFVITPAQQFERFLILGSEGGSYYTSEQALTSENTKNIIKFIEADGMAAVNMVVDVSSNGRAKSNAPAIYALVLASLSKNPDTKRHALMNLNKVARTATDMFLFVEQFKAMGGGFGTMVRKALASWYQSKGMSNAAYQIVKYRNRNGWAHHDVHHLAHIKPTSDAESNLYAFAKSLQDGKTKFKTDILPEIAVGYLKAKEAKNSKEVISLINDYNLDREMIPNEFLNDAKVWDALLPHMKATALIRNLGKMTSVGLISSMSEAETLIKNRLKDAEWLQKSRIHPLTILNALAVYKQGHGDKGSLSWSATRQILDALDGAFYKTFKNVEPTGKRIHMSLDISGSMGGGYGFHEGGVSNKTKLSPREISAAMALVTMNVEENVLVTGFSHSLIELDISPKQRLDQVVKSISGLPFGNTDCSLPMQWSAKKSIDFDAFCIYTDNETYAGRTEHPSQALVNYAKKTNNPAVKMIVCGTTASNFSIADPKNPNMLDVVGFDTSVPALISQFIK